MAEGQTRLQQLQEGAAEVRGIMLENYNKAEAREGKLEELDDRAEKLLQQGEAFRKSTRRVKEKMERESRCLRFKNKKVMAAIAGAVVLVVVIIVVIIATQNQNKNEENSG